MTLILVPLSLLAIAALLALASNLEQRRTKVLVRFTVRSSSTPDEAERLIAEELAPLLAAEGLDRAFTRSTPRCVDGSS